MSGARRKRVDPEEMTKWPARCWAVTNATPLLDVVDAPLVAFAPSAKFRSGPEMVAHQNLGSCDPVDD